MKANAVKIGGEWRDVYKDPVTDQGKRSKKGRLAVVGTDSGGHRSISASELGDHDNLLEVVFRNGQLIKEISFEEVRANAA